MAADKEARERLVEATKYRMVPTIEVDGKFFVGWNEHREEILDLLERLRDEAANN